MNNKEDLKLLVVIVAGVLIALIAFTIGKSAWDNHQAAVAKKQAAIVAAEQARQSQISNYISNPQTLPRTWAEVDILMASLNLDHQTRSSLTMTWLGEMWDRSREVNGDYLTLKEHGAPEESLEKAKSKVNSILIEYNKGAATMDSMELKQAGLFTEFPLVE